MIISQSIIDRITSRLAREPEWAQSPLGKALAETVDLKVVSLKVMADAILLKDRALYRALGSESGQPRFRQEMREVFEQACDEYRVALRLAYNDNAFKDIQWTGDQTRSAREEALRILIRYIPVPT